MAAGNVGVLPVLLSLPWVPEPGLVPDVTHSPLKRDLSLGLFSPSVPAVSLLLYHDLLLSPLRFSLHLKLKKKKKKNQVTKQFSLRVKALQTQACYLYSILMNNSPTLMPCV